MIRFGSVCSGMEAASAAWNPLGWKAAWFAEIDPFPSALLKHRYPETHNYGDFTAIPADAPAIDVLVGGTPCQSFSVAGLRGGLSDSRGNLALEYLRLANRLRPRWLVWENVPGVLSSVSHDAPDPCPPHDPMDMEFDGQEMEGEDVYDSEELHAFSCFLAGLAELGYGFAYRVLDAQYFGVPQRRRRVFVVGYLGDWRRAAAVLFERYSLSGNHPPRREAGQGITHDVSPSLTGSGRGTERAGDSRGQDCVIPILEAGARTGKSTDDIRAGIGIGQAGDPMFTLQSGKQHAVAFQNTGQGWWNDDPVAQSLRDASAGGASHANLVCGAVSSKWAKGTGGPAGDECYNLVAAPPLTGNPYGDHESREGFLVTATLLSNRDAHSGFRDSGGLIVQVATFDPRNVTSKANRTRVEYGSPANTLHEQGLSIIARSLAIRGRHGVPQAELGDDIANAVLTPNGGRGGIGVGAMMQGSAVRRLTPRECERLQGFPDDWTLIPYRGKLAADGPRYKALGNSFAVPVVRWIGERIQVVHDMAMKEASHDL